MWFDDRVPEARAYGEYVQVSLRLVSEISTLGPWVHRGELTEMLHETAKRFGHEIFSLEIADDHVHLFIQCDPKWSPAEVAKQLKGYSGRTLLERHPELKKEYFRGSGLWKDGYYVGTTGNVAADVVQRYIDETEHT